MKFTSLSLCRGPSDSHSDTKVIYSAEAHAFFTQNSAFFQKLLLRLSSLSFHCACLCAMKVCRHRLTSVHNYAWQIDVFSFENIEVFILHGNYHPSTIQDSTISWSVAQQIKRFGLDHYQFSSQSPTHAWLFILNFLRLSCPCT